MVDIVNQSTTRIARAFDSFSKQPFPREIVWGFDSPIRCAGGAMAFLPLNELPALFSRVVSWISYVEKQAQESGQLYCLALKLLVASLLNLFLFHGLSHFTLI